MAWGIWSRGPGEMAQGPQRLIWPFPLIFLKILIKAKTALGGGPRTRTWPKLVNVDRFGRNLVGVVGGTWGDAPWVKKVILTFPVKKYF